MAACEFYIIFAYLKNRPSQPSDRAVGVFGHEQSLGFLACVALRANQNARAIDVFTQDTNPVDIVNGSLSLIYLRPII